MAIQWHKLDGKIYPYHGYVYLHISLLTSLFIPEIAEVSVINRNNDIPKRKSESTFYETKITRYLPITNVHPKKGILIYLNDGDLIERLCLNIWTKDKKGNVKIFKSFPTQVIVKGDEMCDHWNFDTGNMVTPYLISQPMFSQIGEGDKLEVRIYK